MSLPSKNRRRLRSTNALERLNQEIPRRERVIRIFPNVTSAIRLLGALLCEQNEAWISGRKWLDMTDYRSMQESTEELSGAARVA